jgi:hypothetical protein
MEPKGVFEIPLLPDCEVSDLYVAKHQNELIYCVKMTWSVESAATQASSAGSIAPHNDDTSSFASDLALPECHTITHVASEVSPQKNNNNNAVTEKSIVQSPEAAKKKSVASLLTQTPQRVIRKLSKGSRGVVAKAVKGKHVRGGGGSKGSMDSMSLQSLRSVDKESLSQWTKKHDSNHRFHKSDPCLGVVTDIPSNIELDNRMNPLLYADESKTTESTSNRRPRSSLYEAQQKEEQHYLRSQYLTNRKAKQQKTKRAMVQSSKVAVAGTAAIGLTVATAGLGLIVGLALLGAGAVAGGGSAAVGAWRKKATGEIVIASVDYETARMWKSCLDASKDSACVKQSTWGQLFSDGRRVNSALLPRLLEVPVNSSTGEAIARFEGDAIWRPVEGGWATLLGIGNTGLRIFREEEASQQDQQAMKLGSLKQVLRPEPPAKGPTCPPVKAHVVLNSSPVDAFLCLMSYGRMAETSTKKLTPNSEQRASFRLLQSIDDHTDIIHLFFRPLFLFPSWAMPRDYVLFRYWRLEQDGSYVVCYESMHHPACPVLPDYVRGEMHQVVTIAPQKKSYRRRMGTEKKHVDECFMTAIVQVDPKGWVPVSPFPFLSQLAYGDAYGISALHQIADIRDAIDQDRFVPVSFDSAYQKTSGGYHYSSLGAIPPKPLRNRSLENDFEEILVDDIESYDFTYAAHESNSSSLRQGIYGGIGSYPPPLPADKWAEPDSNSFLVRGPTYLTDKHKINAGPSIARLVVTDIVTVDQPIYTGFCLHPTERVQLALKKERELGKRGLKSSAPAFIFVVNIVLPGPPYFHGVFYYAIDDMSSIDGTDGSPSSKLCNEFFFGDSDEFRDRTFKLIPQIVHGNFIVKKAVGSTPAVMGKKLRQLYVKSDRFFEIILDCGSSQVATGVIRLSLGYATTLVVDMGFLLEGNDASVLPERLLGSVRMKYPSFGPHLRKVLSEKS